MTHRTITHRTYVKTLQHFTDEREQRAKKRTVVFGQRDRAVVEQAALLRTVFKASLKSGKLNPSEN